MGYWQHTKMYFIRASTVTIQLMYGVFSHTLKLVFSKLLITTTNHQSTIKDSLLLYTIQHNILALANRSFQSLARRIYNS